MENPFPFSSSVSPFPHRSLFLFAIGRDYNLILHNTFVEKLKRTKEAVSGSNRINFSEQSRYVSL
jgi:hypothetical protein